MITTKTTTKRVIVNFPDILHVMWKTLPSAVSDAGEPCWFTDGIQACLDPAAAPAVVGSGSAWWGVFKHSEVPRWSFRIQTVRQMQLQSLLRSVTCNTALPGMCDHVPFNCSMWSLRILFKRMWNWQNCAERCGCGSERCVCLDWWPVWSLFLPKKLYNFVLNTSDFRFWSWGSFSPLSYETVTFLSATWQLWQEKYDKKLKGL